MAYPLVQLGLSLLAGLVGVQLGPFFLLLDYHLALLGLSIPAGLAVVQLGPSPLFSHRLLVQLGHPQPCGIHLHSCFLLGLPSFSLCAVVQLGPSLLPLESPLVQLGVSLLAGLAGVRLGSSLELGHLLLCDAVQLGIHLHGCVQLGLPSCSVVQLGPLLPCVAVNFGPSQ